MSDLIDRQAAISYAISGRIRTLPTSEDGENWIRTSEVRQSLLTMPSAQPERDIPMKPNETIDSSWGIRKKQAVCPKCDYYLGHVEFIGNPNGKKVTYCETCGQAIDWEGWEWEE